MPAPPTLPNRPSKQERQPDAAIVAEPSIPHPDTTDMTPPRLPPRQKAGMLNVIPDTHASKRISETTATATSAPNSQPSAPRFVAPAATSTSGCSPLRTVLDLFPSQRQDTPEEALIRRQLEEEQIARYMNSFSKHVQYLRIEPGSAGMQETKDEAGAGDGRKRPSVEEFRSAIGPGVGGENATTSPGLTGTSGEQGSHVPVEGEDHAIDWFGYYAAVSGNVATQIECH